jgi:hypothetical protein
LGKRRGVVRVSKMELAQVGWFTVSRRTSAKRWLLFAALSRSNRRGYFIQHRVKIVIDILVHHAKKPDPKRLNVMLAAEVINPGERCEMAVAVDFDCQLQFRAIEVDNKPVDAVLASELVAEHLPVGKVNPQEHFGRRDMTSEIAASFLERSDVVMKGHRREEVIGTLQFAGNLVSCELGNKEM